MARTFRRIAEAPTNEDTQIELTAVMTEPEFLALGREIDEWLKNVCGDAVPASIADTAGEGRATREWLTLP